MAQVLIATNIAAHATAADLSARASAVVRGVTRSVGLQIGWLPWLLGAGLALLARMITVVLTRPEMNASLGLALAGATFDAVIGWLRPLRVRPRVGRGASALVGLLQDRFRLAPAQRLCR